ncbi:MAG: DUF4249 family protein [Bacteroidales bacterium]
MRKSVFIIVAIITLFSCDKTLVDINTINFSNAELDYEIAISGFISTEKTRHKVTLTKPAAIGDQISYNPISNADVSLTDGVNSYPLEWIDEKRAYYSVDSIRATPGVEYSIEVVYDGKTYTASDRVPVNSINDTINPFKRTVTYDDNGNIRPPDDDWIELSVTQHNFGFDKQQIMLMNDIIGEDHISDSMKNIYSDIVRLNQYFRVYIHKGSLPQGIFPAGFSRSGSSGEPADSIELVYMEISDAYYEYLITVFNETDWRSGIFSTIAGNTKSNVSEGGTGYFYAVNTKRIRVTFQDLINSAM